MKENFKKIVKGFSLIEVVVAVNLLALILAILGLSVLGSQRLIINAQTRSEISKIGEGILDYVCSLPISDRVANPAGDESPNNNIHSISDFVTNGIIDNDTVINQMNSILNSGANAIKIGVVQSTDSDNWFPKGRVIQFGPNRDNDSYAEVIRVSTGVYQVRVNIIYQTNPRNPNNIRRIVVSRIVAF
jgi:prepilin-type N-terminal cleavage/methylation domain-containing protein